MNPLKSIILPLILGCGIVNACASDKENHDEPSIPGEDQDASVIFKDDFDTFDSSIWTKETHPAGWTNQELQSYSPANVTVGKDGSKSVLIITAENRRGVITSGRVNSKGKKSFKYGRIEASIKLPVTANGLWPAFWMMGDNAKEWPACGEIDIMEMGDAEGIRTGNTDVRVNTAIHYGTDVSSHEQQYYGANFSKSLQDGKYHMYAMQWNENAVEISIDGVRFKTFDTKNNKYFQDQFFILFNLAVGGSFTGITDVSGITSLKDGEKARMYVDWIKISE